MCNFIQQKKEWKDWSVQRRRGLKPVQISIDYQDNTSHNTKTVDLLHDLIGYIVHENLTWFITIVEEML